MVAIPTTGCGLVIQATSSIFRIYCDKDGKPAKYSKDNVPYKPKHFLPVNISGIKEGDFSMILGYPGRTDRYLTSEGVAVAVDQVNPAIVKIRTEKLDIIKDGMNKDKKVAIQYASKYKQSSNYWKYFIGQTKQLKRMRVFDQKLEQENSLHPGIVPMQPETKIWQCYTINQCGL
ncbi:MAG: S46 family peptidase [Bacteroidetes bacterium]|nr:S46 family peptidase [Bacteroidota bacterium]